MNSFYRIIIFSQRKAGIPVKTISGFAKGYGYSPMEPFSVKGKTNHAWNAVQISGKWYLLDCTWGAGNVDSKTKDFKKVLKDFYFLTEPKQFITDHFPYMDNNLEESQKWQLLSKPVSLEEFNSNVKYSAHAFRTGVFAITHNKAYFEVRNQTEIVFKSVKKKDIKFTAKLMFDDGKCLAVQRNATFCYKENDIYKVLVHPQKTGKHQLNIFCKLVSDENQEGIPYMLGYYINCTGVQDKSHEYPIIYPTADVEKCFLHEPMKGNLPEKTMVQFRISSPHLQYIVIDHIYFEKHGNMFICPYTTPDKGHNVNIFGKSGDKRSKSSCLYTFRTV